MSAAFLGAAVNRMLEPAVVLVGFAGVMIAAGVQMLRARDQAGGSCALPTGGVNWRSCLPNTVVTGLVVGFLTGLFGVGGGFLIVPALVLLLGLPMATAVPTSLVIIVINAVAGFAAHASATALDYEVTGTFTLAAVAGALVAGRVAPRVPAARLQRWFAHFVFVVAGFVLLQNLG